MLESFLKESNDTTIVDNYYVPKCDNSKFSIEEKKKYLGEAIRNGGYYGDNDCWNSIMTFPNDKNVYRGRVETLVIKDNKYVYLKFLPREKQNEKRKYLIPGGSFELNIPNDQQAINECMEEARLKICNVQSTGITYKEIKEPPKWAIEKQPVNWNGNYTEVYVAEYDGKYTGHIDKVDEDKFMITGKFYKLDEIFKYLKKEHKEALKVIYPHRFNDGKYVKESVNERKNVNIKQIKNMIKKINEKYIKDKKEPTGNQNCLLCTWCIEAWFRGYNILPRPIYSPTDKVFDFEGYDIVKNSVKINIKDKIEMKKIISVAGNNSRFYTHVKWSKGNGGHEFILININDEIYVLDAQQGLLENIKSSKGSYYFKDIDYSKSYIVRMDDKEFNKSMIKYNDDRYIKDFTKEDMKYVNEASQNKEKLSANKMEILLGNLTQKITIDYDAKKFTIKGINFNKFIKRLKFMYSYRRIEYLFEKRYSYWSTLMWEKEVINKNDMKIVNLTIPLFFALELYGIFLDLAEFYKINYYKRVANNIYKHTWISNFEKREGIQTDISKLSNLAYTPKDYQLEFIKNYNKLKYIYDLEGYILSFEQGLGKTFTSIALAECLNKDQIIIVCPNSLTENWAYEIRGYFNKYNGNDSLWKNDIFIPNNYRFKNVNAKYKIVNQESIDKIFSIVDKNKNTMIIVDESHNFRNKDSDRSNKLLKLKEITKCKDNLLMSGTPIKASPNEIIPSLRMIDPYFTNELSITYSKVFSTNSTEIAKVVKRRFKRTILRKTKNEVLKLPEKNISQILYKIPQPGKYLVSVIHTDIANEYESVYKEKLENLKSLRTEFDSMVKKYSSAKHSDTKKYLDFVNMRTNQDTPTVRVHEHRLSIYNQFLIDNVYPNIKDMNDRKRLEYLVTQYINMVDVARGIAVGKILPPAKVNCYKEIIDNNYKDIIKRIDDNLKKTVIFTPFLEIAHYLEDVLTKNNMQCIKIVGSTKNRMDLINEFKSNDNIDVLIATTQTLSTGITLTESNQMFFFGTPYRSADFNQACDRIHRIGQTMDVNIYTILLNTKDEKNVTTRIQEILDWSQDQFDNYIGYMSESVVESIDIKNPMQLLKWMKSNIRYSHESNWKLKTYDEVIETKCGDCHDQSLFEYSVFKDLNIKCGRLFMIEYTGDKIHNAGTTHTICYFISNNKYYWFENAWEDNRGIHGPYDDLNLLKDDIYNNWDFSSKYDRLYICTLGNVKSGMNLEDYVCTALHNNFNPKKYYKKDNKTITESANNIYYRITYNDIGIYEAFRQSVSFDIWKEFKNSDACKWLPLPPKYENNYYSYFTYEGYKKFMDLTYPKMLKYLNKDKIETSVVELDENSIVYSDKYQIVATNNNYMIESEDNCPDDKEYTMESVIFNSKDTYYNKDKFDSGEINLCFITGFSGSGKSTMANEMENSGIEKYELDDIAFQFNFSDDNLKEYGGMIYSFFNGPGKKYRAVKSIDDLKTDKEADDYQADICIDFIDYAKKYASSHKDKKFVVEGVEIFGAYIDKIESLKDYAIYIKGTSLFNSYIRSAKRDSQDAETDFGKFKSFMKMIASSSRFKQYLTANTRLNKIKKQINEYVTESEDKSELTKGFKSKTSNIQYKTLSIDKPEIYDYLKNHFSKNDPMWEGVKDSKTYMDCFINGNNRRHVKRVGEVLINKANDEVIGFEVVDKPDNYLAIEIPYKKYRGYGFGSLLLEDAIKKHGCKKLYVAKDNKIALKMYTNRGFEITGEFYDGEWWHMELKE